MFNVGISVRLFVLLEKKLLKNKCNSEFVENVAGCLLSLKCERLHSLC